MEMYNLPVMQRWMSDDGINDFKSSFVRLADQNATAAANLVQSIATSMNSLAGKAGTCESSEERDKLTALRSRLCYLIQIACIAAVSVTDNRFFWMVFQVKIEKALGTTRSNARLRSVIDTVSGAPDQSEAIDWLCSQIEISKCEHCEGWEYTVKLLDAYDSYMDVELICRRCASTYYRVSELYEPLIHADNYREARDENNNWVSIHEGDGNFHYDEDRDCWVHDNWEPPEPPVIRNYHSSKDYQRVIVDDWSKVRHRWFGVELEVEIKDGMVDKEEKAKLLHSMINDSEYGKRAFFENDGSLTHGFEIITQPMSLPAHHEVWNWLKDREAVRYLLSHNTRTCGLHVHVNRDSLSQIQIAKIVTFVNDPRNEQMIRAIARRYAEGYCKIKEKKLEDAHQSTDRYEAVNVTPRKTIEFRIFKGSLKYESVIAAIEFCNALCDFTTLPSTNDVASLNGENFIDFINNQGATETTVLRPYMNAVLQTA